MIITKEVGKCPYCKSESISYGETTLDGEMLSYECVCDACGKTFQEWYVLEYCETVGLKTGDSVAEEIRACLEGMPCPICTKGFSDEVMQEIDKKLNRELKERFGEGVTKEGARVNALWWELLEREALDRGMKYYEDITEKKIIEC